MVHKKFREFRLVADCRKHCIFSDRGDAALAQSRRGSNPQRLTMETPSPKNCSCSMIPTTASPNLSGKRLNFEGAPQQAVLLLDIRDSVYPTAPNKRLHWILQTRSFANVRLRTSLAGREVISAKFTLAGYPGHSCKAARKRCCDDVCHSPSWDR